MRDDVRETYELDRKLVGSADAFMLEVKGDSMAGMGILSGDAVIVEPADESDLENGDVVAARVDGDATVKRYFANGGQVVLEPANPRLRARAGAREERLHGAGAGHGAVPTLTRAHTEAIVTGDH